jgi:hypothetical protein
VSVVELDPGGVIGYAVMVEPARVPVVGGS